MNRLIRYFGKWQKLEPISWNSNTFNSICTNLFVGKADGNEAAFYNVLPDELYAHNVLVFSSKIYA